MTETLPQPASREEEYLATIAGMTGIELPTPASRKEEYLNAIAQNGGGGGGGGTTNFNDLTNRPKYNGTTMDGNTNIPEVPRKMVVLSYGTSTWQDFINAYNDNAVVYCRASSNVDPSSGSQTRLAFMAYVSNATSPTSVEFQYYRSVNSKTAAQQNDQVFVYKLTSANGGTWTVETRETGTEIAAGAGLSSSYSNGTLTLAQNEGLTTNVTLWAGNWYTDSLNDPFVNYQDAYSPVQLTANSIVELRTDGGALPVLAKYGLGILSVDTNTNTIRFGAITEPDIDVMPIITVK